MFRANLVEGGLKAAMQKLLEAGVEPERLVQTLPDVIGPMINQAAEVIVDAMMRTQAAMLEEHRSILEQFDAELAESWGNAFDAFYAGIVAAEESASGYHQWALEEGLEAGERFLALTQLSARTVLVAKEVLTLLRGGFANGASVRRRTLHELAVIAIVLAENPPSLSHRYLRYEAVERWQDAQDYQEHVGKLNEAPLTDAEIDEVGLAYDEVMLEFGKGFNAGYGWAAPLFPAGKGASFEKLERLAGISHLHPYYKLDSHHMHAGSKGLLLNQVQLPDGDGLGLMTGPADRGISDVADGALISLGQVMIAFLLHGTQSPSSPDAVLVTLVLDRMLTRARDAFVTANAAREPIPLVVEEPLTKTGEPGTPEA
jgi:hypothetical protein